MLGDSVGVVHGGSLNLPRKNFQSKPGLYVAVVNTNHKHESRRPIRASHPRGHVMSPLVERNVGSPEEHSNREDVALSKTDCSQRLEVLNTSRYLRWIVRI